MSRRSAWALRWLCAGIVVLALTKGGLSFLAPSLSTSSSSPTLAGHQFAPLRVQGSNARVPLKAEEAATESKEGKKIDFVLLAYFALWYLGNYYYNITNKRALTAAGGVHGFPMTIATLQLGVGCIWALLLWGYPDTRKLPELTASDYQKTLAVGATSAGAEKTEVAVAMALVMLEELLSYLSYSVLLVPVPFFVLLHASLTGGTVQSLLQSLMAEWQSRENRARAEVKLSQRQLDQKLRFDEEVLRTRVRMLTMFNKLMIHFSFAVSLATFWKLINSPSLMSFFQFMGPILGYSLDASFLSGLVKIKTHEEFRVLEIVGLSIQVIFALSIGMETDFKTFCVSEKISGVLFFFMSVTIIDRKVTLPLYIFEAIVHIARCLVERSWQLIGFDHLTPQIVYSSLASHIIFAATLAFIDQIIINNIAAKLDSGDASSLMRGFRQVLRGVCDGDLVLDSRDWSIVEDASCLERLLKCNKALSETNFLDLFLDAESRENFVRFLSSDVVESSGDGDADGSPCSTPASRLASSVPRGLRVSLQGATGPVSLDLFCTRLPGQGPAGSDQCLLALKEDPEQVLASVPVPADASPPLGPLRTAQEGRLPPQSLAGRSRSSVSEVVEAYDELVEVALLVSNSTGLLDIEEAHLSFQRQSNAPRIETGMPTLRRFIRPSDWDRERQRCYFRRPMLFRLPGESRSYLCSRQTSVSRADRYVVPGSPVHYWMHLTAFDSSQVQRAHAASVFALNAGAVSFGQIVKAAEPAFAALLGVMFYGQKVSVGKWLCLIPVIGGVVLASLGEMNFAWAALLTAAMANVFAAIKGNENKKLMQTEGLKDRMGGVGNQFAITMLNSFGFCLIIMLLTEGSRFGAFMKVASTTPAVVMNLIMSGLWFYAYNELATFTIKKTNAVTSSVANTAKRVIVIVGVAIVMHESLSPLKLAGCAIGIGGVFLYSIIDDLLKKK
eukprot:s535_g8.t2